MSYVEQEKVMPKKLTPTNMTAVKNMKFSQAIKIGHHERLFIESKAYEIGIQGNLIVRIQEKNDKKDVAYTTLMNVVCWHV